MTTIAYRDGIIAADRLVTAGNMRAGFVTKIFAAHDMVVGISGSLSDLGLFQMWFNSELLDTVPSFSDEVDGIVVDADHNIFYIGAKGNRVMVAGEYAAVGSGEEYAMAAMAMGADARKAVEIAIQLDTLSGGGIDVLTAPKQKGHP